MKIRAFMARLKYDETVLTTKINNKAIVISPCDLVEVLSTDEDYPAGDWRLGWENSEKWFITRNHFGNGISVIAFELDPEGDGDLEDYQLRHAPHRYDEALTLGEKFSNYEYMPKYNCFLQLPYFKWDNKEKRYKVCNDLGKAVAGSIVPGDFFVFLENKHNGDLIKAYRVTAMPSSVNISDFRDMIDDILRVKRELLMGKESHQTIHYKSVDVYFDSVEKAIEALKGPLEKISQNPKNAIKEVAVSNSLNRIKKFDDRFFAEFLANPGKGRYATVGYENNIEIYENQVIKYTLQALAENIEDVYEDQEYYREEKLRNLKSSKEDFANAFPYLTLDEIDEVYNSLENNHNQEVLGFLASKCFENPKRYRYDVDTTIRVKAHFRMTRSSYSTCLHMIFANGVLKSSYRNRGNYNVLRFNAQPQLMSYVVLDNSGNVMTDYWGNTKENRPNWYVNLEFLSNEIQKQYELYYAIKNYEEFEVDLEISHSKYCDNKLNPLWTGNSYERDLQIVNINSIAEYENDLFMTPDSCESNLISLFQNYGAVESSNENFKLNHDRWQYLKDGEIQASEKESRDRYDKLIVKINDYLSLPLFQKIEAKCDYLRSTQIFLNDARYRQVYKILKKLAQRYRFTERVDKNSLLVNKVDKIYEYWILVKMAYVLQYKLGWEPDSKNNLLEMIDNILNSKTQNTDGKSMLFFKRLPSYIHRDFYGNVECLPEFVLGCEVLFNQRIEYIDKYGKTGEKQPDYFLHLGQWIPEKRTFSKIPMRIYLDAKYKKFSDLRDVNGLAWELGTVAIAKYIESFRDDDEINRAQASFIVHSDNDSKYRFWGSHFREDIYDALKGCDDISDSTRKIYKSLSHKCGSFAMLPSNSDDFMTFLRMVLEFHFIKYSSHFAENILDECNPRIYERLCCECGSTNVSSEPRETAGQSTKYHITCNDCGNFWVKNHCKDSKGAHSLFKHYFHNFQEPVEGELWYVQCPECTDGEPDFSEVIPF